MRTYRLKEPVHSSWLECPHCRTSWFPDSKGILRKLRTPRIDGARGICPKCSREFEIGIVASADRENLIALAIPC